MERRAFIVISVVTGVASTALAASCASFSEGRDTADPRSDAGSDADASAVSADGGAPDGATDAAYVPTTQCSGNLVEDPFDQPFAELGWSINGSPKSQSTTGVPPPSLFAETPMLSAGQPAEHSLKKDFPLSGHKHVCIELDVFLEQTGGAFTNDAYAEVLEIGADSRSLFAEMRTVGFSFTDDSTPAKILGFSFGKWQHLVMRFQFDAVALPSIEVAGSGAGPVTGTKPMAATVPANITVHLGLEAKGESGTAGALRVNIDNFRFTSEP